MKLPAVFFLYVIFFISTIHIVHCSVDEYMSCDQIIETKRKSRVLDQIPCDMQKQSYCSDKGPAYPERAIWKFKEENRALMRRLYGDLESTSLYREMRSTSSWSSSSHMSRSAKGAAADLTFGTAFSGMEYNIRVGSGLATVQSASEPIIAAGGVGRVKIKRKIMKKKRKNDSDVQILTSTTTSTSAVYATTSESPSPSATTTTMDPTRLQTTLQPTTTADSEQMTTNTIAPTETITTFEETVAQTTTTTTTTEIPSPTKTETIETTGDLDTTPSDLLVDSEIILLDKIPVESKEAVASELVDSAQPLDSSVASAASVAPADAAGNEEVIEYEEIEVDEDAPESYVADKVWSLQEGHLDAGGALGEDNEEIDYTGTPVNACPVKEEVFAPYWANNTRDQVLALLNLYPFEQYIHMETCKYEKEEMLCRRGCRCEQQYRLHRLLAFDPSNECRGIFSDWFRFPSYCICKCYHVPPEFMEKKRKPRLGMTPAHVVEPDNDVNNNFRDPKIMREFVNDNIDKSENIPAVLPYEATVAILREMSRADRQLDTEDMSQQGWAQTSDRANGKSGKVRVSTSDSAEDKLDEHFFYANPPIMDYQLSDGSKGSVPQVPRKR